MRKTRCFLQCTGRQPVHAGAFHGVTEADAIINVGVSGPGVVKHALEKVRGENFEVLCETIKKTAFKVTRVGQLVAQEASKRLNIPFGIIDLSWHRLRRSEIPLRISLRRSASSTQVHRERQRRWHF